MVRIRETRNSYTILVGTLLRLSHVEERERDVDATGSGSCPVADFCISSVEALNSATAVLVQSVC